MEPYQKIYKEFIEQYNKMETSPSQVGEVLVKISGLFPNYNMIMVKEEREFNIVHKDIANSTDESTAKAISSAKATVNADASEEAYSFKTARAHVQNIETLMAALKFLQRSLEVEYSGSNI